LNKFKNSSFGLDTSGFTPVEIQLRPTKHAKAKDTTGFTPVEI